MAPRPGYIKRAISKAIRRRKGAVNAVTVAATGAAAVGTAGGSLVVQVAGFAAVLADVLMREHSKREDHRIKKLVELSSDILNEMLDTGFALRTDGFFTDKVNGRSDGDEIIEATLIGAKNSFEENKLPYLAHLMAVIAVDDGLTHLMVNRLIMLAERLTWTQYILIAMVSRRSELNLPDVEFMNSIKSWDAWSVHSQLYELFMDNIFYAEDDPTAPRPIIFDFRLRQQRLARAGELLYQTLGLEKIDRLTIINVIKQLEP